MIQPKIHSNFSNSAAMHLSIGSISRPPSVSALHFRPNYFKLLKSGKILQERSFHCFPSKHSLICNSLTPWEPSPVTYIASKESNDEYIPGSNIFETLQSSSKDEDNDLSKTTIRPSLVKWLMWLLGPAFLLITGIVPTLWLPLSSVFLGPNVASLLSLIGLDCIYSLGAILFLLMADYCARPKHSSQPFYSEPPHSYRLWNWMANISGFIIPLISLYGSGRGILQPPLPFISFLVLLGPYILLLSVQVLTETLTWHWKSPVWLVTPIVYESYRLLQLMRGLKLGAEVSAPAWMVHSIRGLVCWWVLILGVQLMRVAWFAGFAAKSHQQ